MLSSPELCLDFIKTHYNNLFDVTIPNGNLVILYRGDYTNFELNQYPYKAHFTLFKDGSIRLNHLIKYNVLIGSMPIVNYFQGSTKGTGIIYLNEKWQKTDFSSKDDKIFYFH